MLDSLPPGLYDRLLSQRFERLIREADGLRADTEPIDEAEAAVHQEQGEEPGQPRREVPRRLAVRPGRMA